MAGQPNPRRSAGTNVPAGTLALVRSPLALRCSREQNALHTLIHQRHLTPSCRGQAPTAERTLDPARMLTESLNPGPELETQPGSIASEQHVRRVRGMSASPPIASKLRRRSESTWCATSGLLQCSK